MRTEIDVDDQDVILGQSFGRVAETYHRVRPRYSQPLLDRAQELLELGADARVLDLAAGTGRLTHELAQRFAHVVAVEPNDDDARADRRRRSSCRRGGGDPARATRVSTRSSSARRSTGSRRRKRSRRSRACSVRAAGSQSSGRTGGRRSRRCPTRRWSCCASRGSASRRSASRAWDDAFADSPFEPLRYERFEDAITVDPDALLELYSTTSSLAAISREERDALFAKVRTLLAGPYRLPLKHELTWTRLA